MSTYDASSAKPELAALRSPRFLIISEPRTGSNNVSYVLSAHPDLVVGNELLHHANGMKQEDFPGIALAPLSPRADGFHWIASMPHETRRSVCAAIFAQHNGFKIHSQHLPPELIGEIVQDFDCQVIVTTRVDLFGQAISNAVAQHVGRWHADERRKHTPVTTFNIPPPRLLAWIESVVAARLKVWNVLAPLADRVFMCQYEIFFSGAKEARLVRFLHMLDFLGVPRFGRLPEEQMVQSIKRALYFLDPTKQKMTSEQSAQESVENYAELREKYEQWTTRSFAKLLPS